MQSVSFSADLRRFAKTGLTSFGSSQTADIGVTITSSTDLQCQLLALAAHDPGIVLKSKSQLRMRLKNFMRACERVSNNGVVQVSPLQIFSLLGGLCCESIIHKVPAQTFKIQSKPRSRLAEILCTEFLSSELENNILLALHAVIEELFALQIVDKSALIALVYRLSLENGVSIPVSIQNSLKSGNTMEIFASHESTLLENLLSLGLSEVIEVSAHGVPSETTDPPDSFTVAMRRQLQSSIAEKAQSVVIGASTRDPSTAQSWSTLKALLSQTVNDSCISTDQLVDICFTFLTSGGSDEEILDQLFDVLGYESFDAVSNLLSNRAQWVLWYKKYLTDPEGIKKACNQQQHCPKSRKTKRSKQQAEPSDDTVHLLLHNPEALVQEREADLAIQQSITNAVINRASDEVRDLRQRLPFVFDALAERRNNFSFHGHRQIMLPEDTVQMNSEHWAGFQFPIPKKENPDFVSAPLIEIKHLDRIGRIAFKDIERLNLIQSIVFDAAYNSSENLLISAPTGAGKTNTAMLAVVHLIREHINQDEVLNLKDFKIVYMAPMKALAAEMTTTFGKRLAPLGIKVRECTGDMQLSKQEIIDTQMLVTTPEKWDVISRKGTGDASLVQALKLLIIDEIHLLHEDRGAVIEALVARTIRQVEVSQSMIRIVGLSATLPNYQDVALFLRVNLSRGLFYFDARFRPVPLGLTFIGVTPEDRYAQEQAMNEACYESLMRELRKNEQAMVFVHARGETVRTARWIANTARDRGDASFLEPLNANTTDLFKKVAHCRDMGLRELAPLGLACHHAGMLRPDRRLAESLFVDGAIRVLVCTATLAWGVNLPAHAVVIKGTKIYDADRSDFVDLDVLDVVQIFGRAGRPQFDTFGLATIITTRDKLDHYVRLITNQVPIESKLLENINDHLNAEIALGTVTNITEAITWLSYTYLFVRLQKSPMHYGITGVMLQNDPDLTQFMTRVLTTAARDLNEAEMVRYEESTGQLASTDRGRTASLYYIKYETASMVRDSMHALMLIPDLFVLISRASEFGSMKVRDDEEVELNSLLDEACRVSVKSAGTMDIDFATKVNVLLQAYISRCQPACHSLVSDMFYIQQNAGRLARYMFEVALRRAWSACATNAHCLSKMIERRIWFNDSPLWQLTEAMSNRTLERVDEINLSVDKIRELGPDELKHILRYDGQKGANYVYRLAQSIPLLKMAVETQPVTRNIIRCRIGLEADFTWVDAHHGGQQSYWVWIEDPDDASIYHSELFTLSKKTVISGDLTELIFTIPVHDPIPPQYLVRCMSDHWLGADSVVPILFRNMLLPQADPPHTDLLPLEPLPITVLGNTRYEMLYNFTHFNAIQSQVFHSLYHQDVNILLGSPTGSGKTVAAELAIFRVFNTEPHKKCVYIAPLKALVRERVDDWTVKIGKKLGKRVVELTGDVSPDIGTLRRSDLIVTTPEKWDGISRMWRQRAYVRDIALIVIDEIHMVGEERGPVLEVIVSRANFIANQLATNIRVVGLSTALANAVDMAAWLRVPLSPEGAPDQGKTGLCGRGLFNFRPSVRPVPLEVHIQGFAGRHYCPRMATMNKPIFQAIESHSPEKPVLIFVASRRQTRRTAFDLISFSQAAPNSRKWLQMDVHEMENLVSTMADSNLQVTLLYGIGLHHAGLRDRDRRIVEELFVNQKIQVLVATSTLAWGVNFPAHLVIIKGTEYFDGKTKRYVDFPITDVLQMMGRAGRPQFDDEGKAVVMVQDTKKAFYKRFLYEPFPVESCLLQVMPDYLNAEIATGSINSMQSALECITWTFFFRRLLMNPNYYQLEDTSPESVNKYLSATVSTAVTSLIDNSCVEVDPEDPLKLCPTSMGRLAAFYYLSHKTMGLFTNMLTPNSTIPELIHVLSLAEEFALLPVRHSEDETNAVLATEMPLPITGSMESPHTKAHILLQAYFSRRTLQLPVSDYVTDTKSVLDQAPRVLQALIDYCADSGWLACTLRGIQLAQMLCQSIWLEDSPLLQLPGVNSSHLCAFKHPKTGAHIETLPELFDVVHPPPYTRLYSLLDDDLSPDLIKSIKQALPTFPLVSVTLDLIGIDPYGPPLESDCRRRLPIIGLHIPEASAQASAVHAYLDTDYLITVSLRTLVPCTRSTGRAQNMSGHFSGRHRDCGWFLVLGTIGSSAASSNLLALRKVPGGLLRRSAPDSAKSFNLSFRVDSGVNLGDEGYPLKLTVFLMSDTYLSLDQQISFQLQMHPCPQVISEEESDYDVVGLDASDYKNL